jgi:GNAT superfamily N-acetyltransferase
MTSQTVKTLRQRPDLVVQVPRLHRDGWPTFLRQDPVADRYWEALFTTFADFQLVAYSRDDDIDTVIAAGHSIPIVWDGTIRGLPDGWDAALEQGFRDREHGLAPTTLSALAVVVAPAHQGHGISKLVLRALKALAAARGLDGMIAPVRPVLKSRYPLAPMERYVRWTRADGSPFDPWLRVHWSLGAEPVRLAPQSMVITGTVSEWEAWATMPFPESGVYVVPGALQPVAVDRERDVVRYEDPNVWMRHPADEAAAPGTGWEAR